MDSGHRELQKALGIVIAMQRRRVNLSQEGLAKASGLGESTIARLETGARSAKIDQLAAIAASLGLPISSLVAEAERGGQAGRPSGRPSANPPLPPHVAREIARLEHEEG